MTVQQIDIHAAKELIDNNDCTIVDVRDEHSFNCGHIEHAYNVSDTTLESFLAKTDKTKPLVCYCFHGHSSQMAAQYFLEQGFRQVYSIDGGFEEWRLEYPVKRADS